MSVWVEIHVNILITRFSKSRSTWACELKFQMWVVWQNLWSHAPRERVSWNNSISRVSKRCRRHAPRERVSWNLRTWKTALTKEECHAPRERVSWNLSSIMRDRDNTGHAPRERVSWNTNILVSFINHSSHAPRERVSWNLNISRAAIQLSRHAPRERVSWNDTPIQYTCFRRVTLHVSVWVEITPLP